MPGDPRDYGAPGWGRSGMYRLRNRQGRFVQNGFGIEWNGLELIDEVFQQYGENMHAVREQVAEQLAQQIEAYMKIHAPWDDRTTDARKGLKAFALHEGVTSSVYAGYSSKTPYGYFLENYTYRGVSYAIVRPTIEKFAQDMGATIKDAMP